MKLKNTKKLLTLGLVAMSLTSCGMSYSEINRQIEKGYVVNQIMDLEYYVPAGWSRKDSVSQETIVHTFTKNNSTIVVKAKTLEVDKSTNEPKEFIDKVEELVPDTNFKIKSFAKYIVGSGKSSAKALYSEQVYIGEENPDGSSKWNSFTRFYAETKTNSFMFEIKPKEDGLNSIGFKMLQSIAKK